MNMKLLVVVTQLYIYTGCYTRKKLWEEKFTPMRMKSCGCRDVREKREIKDGKKYITLDIYLNFGSLYKIKSHLQNQNTIW